MRLTQEQIIEFCHNNTIIDYLGIEVIPTDDGGVQLELSVDAQHTNYCNICHGGVLTTMADTAMGAACLMLDKKVVTISMTIEFMHSVPMTTRLIADAKVLHNGHQTMVCECNMINAEGKLFSKVHATFFVLELVE